MYTQTITHTIKSELLNTWTCKACFTAPELNTRIGYIYQPKFIKRCLDDALNNLQKDTISQYTIGTLIVYCVSELLPVIQQTRNTVTLSYIKITDNENGNTIRYELP